MTYASDLPDFADLIRATSDAMNLPRWIVEKDYYVTRALHALQTTIGEQFLFKGGTSLSKGWGLIERFSEDIDLLFRTQHDGVDLGKNARHRRFKIAEEVVAAAPGLQLVRPDRPTSSETGMHRESLFRYAASSSPLGVFGATIRLEMNCRGGVHPHRIRPIQSYVGGFAANAGQPDLADDLAPFDIDCLDVTRTFLEKLFAVYAAFEKDRAAGRTRHYYDLYFLSMAPEVESFLISDEFATIFDEVRDFTITYWPEKAVPPGMSFARYNVLRPTASQLADLERNYAAERDLFFREPPPMDAILERLRLLPFPA